MTFYNSIRLQMLSHVSVRSRMLLYSAFGFRTFWYMSVRFGTFRYVSVRFGTFRYISVYFGIFRYVSAQKYLHIYTFIWNIQVCFRSFSYVHVCHFTLPNFSASLRTIHTIWYVLVGFRIKCPNQ